MPYGLGLVKNSYVGRTFIQPSQTIRQLGIRLKLNPLRDVIRGKRLVVVDDTIVRGNTQRALVRRPGDASTREKAETVVEPRRHLLRRQHSQPGGRELDRERQPIEPTADLGDRRGVVGGKREAAADLSRALYEQRDRLVKP